MDTRRGLSAAALIAAAAWLPVVVRAQEAPRPGSAVPQAVPAGRPMNMLATSGTVGDAITPLLWGLIVLSVVVVVIVSALVIVAVMMKPRTRTLPPVERPRAGVGWIYWGVGLSTLALIGFSGWTVATMAAIDKPSRPPAFTIEVDARQWWWSLRYDTGDPSRSFFTANEIHIPVGEPVRFRITSADVIHSFWVPALGGKTDAIPGRINETWLEASKPGVYRGQCAEYCGLEHALMALEVVAQPPAEFAAWWDAQLAEAAIPATAAQQQGQQQFLLRCAACHTVRGTPAGGILGPDLTHLMSRTTIAAGILENTVANLSGWIADPQGLKPGTKMPNIEMSGPDLQSIRTYLETLR